MMLNALTVYDVLQDGERGGGSGSCSVVDIYNVYSQLQLLK